MKLCIAGAAVVLFSAGVNAQLPATGTGVTCVSSDDCALGEMCANSNVCAKIGCQTYYDIVLAQIPGMGDLECEDYAGEFPGLIYACSVGTGISGGSFVVNVNPKDGTAFTQPFQRECKAFIPASNDDLAGEFYCNDNDGASYEDYLKSVGDALLSCDGDAPIHGFPQFNLIGGLSMSALRVETFSETNAESAFYIDIRSVSSSLPAPTSTTPGEEVDEPLAAPVTGTDVTCGSSDDCAPGEFCAYGNVCAKIGCQAYYDILLAQKPGMGDLECEDYAGEFPGLIYACSVGTGISGGSFIVNVNPKDGTAVTQPFQRACKAAIPASNGGVFYCYDNDGASYEDYLKSVGDALFSCDGDAPIHGFPQFNLIGGLSMSALRVETFSETNAESAFYVEIRSGSSSLVTDEDPIDQNTGKSLKASLMTFATVSSVVFFL